MSVTTAPAGFAPPPGRTRVSGRAVARVASAITARLLDVKVSQVEVDLDDEDGALAVIVRAPLRVPAIVPGGHGRPGGSGGLILERAQDIRRQIQAQVFELTGSSVGVVHLHLTHAIIEGGRVQ